MSNMDVTLASPTRGRRSLDAPTAAGAELMATDSYAAGADAVLVGETLMKSGDIKCIATGNYGP